MKLSQSETDCEDSKSYLKSNLTEEEKREFKNCIKSKIDTVIIHGNYIIISLTLLVSRASLQGLGCSDFHKLKS